MKSKQVQKGRRKSRKKDERNYKLIKIGIVFITIILVFVIYKIFNIVVLQNEKIDLSGERYYQYFFGICQNYSGEMKLIINDESKQLFLENDRKVYLDSTPMYYKDILGKMLFAEKMGLVSTNTGNIYRLDEFTNIIEENEMIYVKKFKKEDKTLVNTGSFIYDGKDLYFFLEETTIKIGKKKYKVSPLSYAIVNYKQNVEIYNYDKDEYIILDEKLASSKEVIATDKDGNYKINMSVDSVSTFSSDKLLIKNIDYWNEFNY